MAQWIRHLTTNQGIAGSSPARINIFFKFSPSWHRGTFSNWQMSWVMAVVKAPNLWIEGSSCDTDVVSLCQNKTSRQNFPHRLSFRLPPLGKEAKIRIGEDQGLAIAGNSSMVAPRPGERSHCSNVHLARYPKHLTAALTSLATVWIYVLCLFANLKDIPIHENLIYPPIELVPKVWFSSIDGSAILKPSKLKLSQNNFLTVVP